MEIGQSGSRSTFDAISKGAEEFVEREGRLTVVGLPVTVVKPVEVAARGHHVVEHRPFESVVAASRCQSRVLGVEDEVERVGRDEEVDEGHTEVQGALHGVHGEARPRTGVRVLVVEVVDSAVERAKVDEAVDEVEVELPPKGNQGHPRNKEVRVLVEGEEGGTAMGHHPEVQSLIRSLDAHAEHAEEDVVINLVVEKEAFVVCGLPSGVVLVLAPVPLERVKTCVPASGNDPNEHLVAEKHGQDRILSHLGANVGESRRIRLEVEVGGECDEDVDGVPGPQEGRPTCQPLEEGQGLGRPHKNGRITHWIRRTPFSGQK